MTGTNLYVNKCKQSRSYLKHLVLCESITEEYLTSRKGYVLYLIVLDVCTAPKSLRGIPYPLSF
jgi:hypothetical protein